MSGYMDPATSSATGEWPTPAWLADQLAAEFGPFDLDPAATAANAKAPAFFTRTKDGLSQPWTASAAFLNPPYGAGIRAWIRKAIAETGSGNADVVVMLVPCRPDTAWWREATGSAALVRIWPGRLEFGPGQRAPFPSAVIVLGKLTGRHGADPAWCTVCGSLHWPAYASRETCSERCRKAAYRARVMSQIQAPETGRQP